MKPWILPGLTTTRTLLICSLNWELRREHGIYGHLLKDLHQLGSRPTRSLYPDRQHTLAFYIKTVPPVGQPLVVRWSYQGTRVNGTWCPHPINKPHRNRRQKQLQLLTAFCSLQARRNSRDPPPHRISYTTCRYFLSTSFDHRCVLRLSANDASRTIS